MKVHSSIRWTVLSLALGGMSGCGVFGGGLDGTWVFQWDREKFQEVSRLETEDESYAVPGPDCVSDTDYPIRDMGGTDYSFVEIYLTKGTGIVVSMEGQEMVGTTSGSGFEVEAQFKEVIWADDDTYDQWEWLLKLEGNLASGEISGEMDFMLVDGSGFPSVECLYQSKSKYTAVKLTTEGKPDRPTGTEGGGIENEAETPSTGGGGGGGGGGD